MASLTTDRLRIRPLEPEDAAEVQRIRSLPEVARFQFWQPGEAQEVERLAASQAGRVPGESGTWFQWVITRREDTELIGDIGLHAPGQPHAEAEVELGISLDPAHQGAGYAAEAMRALLGYAFDELRAHRARCSTDPRNLACVRLLEGLGMRREAHFRESLWFKGAWADDLIYAMLEREWRAGQPPEPEPPGSPAAP